MWPSSTYLCCISTLTRRRELLLTQSTLSFELGEFGTLSQDLLLAGF